MRLLNVGFTNGTETTFGVPADYTLEEAGIDGSWLPDHSWLVLPLVGTAKTRIHLANVAWLTVYDELEK